MSKVFSLPLLTVLCAGMLHASEEEKNNIEVTATHVEGTGSAFRAKDGVVVYYQDSVIRADEAVYDKAKHRLILSGNVEMIGYHGTKEHTSHLEIDTQTNTVDFKELFFTNENDIWLLSNEANKTDGNYTFGASMLSSCDVDDPLWKMYFSDGTYDSVDKYMKIYNAKIYFDDVPVFYTPYLAFSTDNQRESGLLFPVLGYSNNEGFLYEQPIYWAINESMDLEFNPQIRINRSVGMYATYRFVDSPYSSGTIRAGYFKDKESFVNEYNLRNSEHYGFEALYESSRFLSQYMPSDYTDGLYLNMTLLNDIEYLNLQKSTLSHFGQVPLQESRLNYFLYNDDWYGGLNAKYFIDTTKESNDETIQTLPALQFHKYLKSLFWDNLTYSLDLQTKRLDRKEGPTLNQAEFRLPIEVSMAFFDDFLNISLGEELYYGRFFFGNDDTLKEDYFQYHSNVHTAKIFSDLTKQYEGFIHVLQPSLSYVKPGIESQKPIDFSELITQNPDLSDLFSVGLPEERATFSLNQFFYDDAMKLIFFQRLSQSYYPDRDYELAEINNEMQYNWHHWQFYNNIYYSYEYDTINESSSRITLHESDYYVSVGHTYKKRLSDLLVTSNDINMNFRYTMNEHIYVDGGLSYSLNENDTSQDSGLKLWHVGGGYKRDCWSVSAQLSSNIVPRAVTDTNTDDRYTQEYSFVFQLNFIPFASIGTGK
jgi:LPS-assembly protein